MATALKHMERSHRRHKKTLPAQMFANKAEIKANVRALKKRGGAGPLQKLIHRMQNK